MIPSRITLGCMVEALASNNDPEGSASAIRCYTKNRGKSRVFCLGTKMGEQFKAGFHEEHISVWDISVWKNLVKCKDHDTLISSWCSAFLASRFSGTKKLNSY